MLSTFDRYLFFRFSSSFAILFVSSFGLFVVIDGFTNVDGFQEGQAGTLGVLLRMFSYYTFQSSLFFEMVGSTLSVVSVMVVFAMLHRQGEIHPLLAAGVPIYRLLFPVIGGTLLVSAGIVVNQELIIPRIAHRLQSPRGEKEDDSRKVEQVNDYETGILIGGKKLYLDTLRMEDARFVLPRPAIVDALTPLSAQEAIYYPKTPNSPSGWKLKNASPSYDELSLTRQGQKTIRATKNPKDLFIVTNVNFDQLYNRSRSYKFVSTAELIRRIKLPAYSIVSVRGQILNLHTRLTRPILNLVAVLVAVPIIVRKEGRSLAGNMAICTGVLACVFGISQASLYLGSVNIISANLSVWIPIILSGTLGAWLSGIAET